MIKFFGFSGAIAVVPNGLCVKVAEVGVKVGGDWVTVGPVGIVFVSA